MKKMLIHAVLLFGLILGLTKVAGAEPLPPPPILPPISRDPVKIEYQRVNVTIEDQIATTHIDQLFINEHDWMLEGVYLFPLPKGATVSELTMWVDGTPIESKILPAQEARAIYDEIVRQLRDPALLEYVGTDAIQANVFPIPPNAERRIEIEYQQILPAENGIIHYTYPQSTDLYTNLPLDQQSIRVEVESNEPIRTIYSPSHLVDSVRDGEFNAVVGYEDANVIADQDFELYYTVTPEEIGLNLLSYKEAGEDGFFLLMVSPSVEVDPNEIVAKDVVVVMDTSGSMAGEKMEQAKEAARYVVNNLNPQDRFNIVTFATGTRSFMLDLVSADEGNAGNFINSIDAIGGTNISLALLEAVNMGDNDRPLTIIFLTDGLATEGITETPLLLNTLSQNAPDSTRLFAFGVGDDVDTILLDSLAEAHRGTTTYVRRFQQIDEEVSSFYAKVSTPVLSDIALDYDDIVVEQMYPSRLPDLFAGTQLIIAGRYRDGGNARLTLSGLVNGEEQTFTFDDNTFRNSGGNDFIPRLWATRAIGHLLSEIRLHGEDAELVQSVVNLSVRYGIITPYTSYLIEEDDIFSQMGRDDMAEEAMMEFEAASEEVSGESAVDTASTVNSMADAEAPIAPAPTMEIDADGSITVANQPIQFVGSKTFVNRNGVWMDTAYNADTMTPQQVGFASDTYFDLLTSAPELGQYMAVGEEVLVVFGGNTYQIVAGEGDRDVTMPETVAEMTTVTDPDPDTSPTNNTTAPRPNPIEIIETGNEGSSGAPYIGIFAAALILPLVIGLLIGRRQRKNAGS